MASVTSAESGAWAVKWQGTMAGPWRTRMERLETRGGVEIQWRSSRRKRLRVWVGRASAWQTRRVLVVISLPTTYQGPAPSLMPWRWPMVEERMTFVFAEGAAGRDIDNRAGAGAEVEADELGNLTLPRKQMPWLSGRVALGRFQSRARARTSALWRLPMGKRARWSWSWRRRERK